MIRMLASLLAAALLAAERAPTSGDPVLNPPPAPPPSAATMKAIQYRAFGGADVLALEETRRPVAGRGEILVKVYAASVNPIDWKVRKGAFPTGRLFPIVPGQDVSGVVVEVGRDVTKFKEGDEVFAFLRLNRGGGYAEYAIVFEDEAAIKPASVDHVAAASVPLAGLTAWQALLDTGKLEAGQTVLIQGAAGGVGSLAVQIAKARGARVIGTASHKNLDLLKSIGVDVAVDYEKERFEDKAKNVDLVLDTVGGETMRRSFASLRADGMIVSIVEQPPKSLGADRGILCRAILVKPSGKELEQIGALIDAGSIRPVVGQTFPLAEARKAQESSETGHARGKTVLVVAPEATRTSAPRSDPAARP